MIEKGNFLWNAGIFLFRAKDMINAFKKHEPDLLLMLKKLLEKE
jgi:mannose-1-phosphate guanylyltransferase/mannose-6-phosphate isomerase